MTQSDMNLLLEMGFDKERAELALKKSGGLQGALEWLEANQDKPLEELKAAAASGSADKEDGDDDDAAEVQANIDALESGVAKSLKCNECGKMFRNQDMASFHASKTEHTDFSESTEEIAPLTEEEKKEKLEMLRQKLKEKRANQASQDREDNKRNEQIRMKANKDSQDAKEELARKAQIADAAKKKREKAEDAEAKKIIKARIEADKAERRRKAEEAKAAREGQAPPVPGPVAAPSLPKVTANHAEARLRLQTPNGNIMKTLPAETTLFELAQQLQSDDGLSVSSFSTTFPKKTFEGEIDFSKTLKEAGLVPSSVLIVK